MIEVAAAIIREGDKILICQRSEEDELGLMWEFPGGKREAGETLEQCAIRELKEELELDIKVIDIYAQTTYRYDQKEIHFTFFNAQIIGGEIQRRVHKDIAWVTGSQLHEYTFMPADIDIVEQLKTWESPK